MSDDDRIRDLTDRIKRMCDDAERLMRQIRDGGSDEPDLAEDGPEELDPANYFYADEPHDIRADDDGWSDFLKAHPELSGFSIGPGVNVHGDAYPLRWHYNWGAGNPDSGQIIQALSRAYRSAGGRPVTTLEIGAVFWGSDADRESCGRFASVLYHAAERGEVVRYVDGKRVTLAPVSSTV